MSLAANENGKNELKELEAVVDVLEDPERRQELVSHLKGLIAARQDAAQKSPRPLEEPDEALIKRFTSWLEELSRSVLSAGARAFELAVGVPDAFRNARRFLENPANRQEIQGSTLSAVAAILGALLAWGGVRGFLRRMKEPKGFLPLRVLIEAATGFLNIVPCAALVVVYALSAGYFSTVPVVNVIFERIFVTLLLYRTALELLRLPFSPHHPGSRILSISDEYANYWWLWIVRLLNYGAVFFLASGILDILTVDRQAFLFIRGILVLPFPLMLSVLIMQVGRDLKIRLSGQLSTSEGRPAYAKGKTRYLALRYAPVFLVVYIWFVAFNLMTGHRAAFAYLRDATAGCVALAFATMLVLRLIDRIFNRLFVIGAAVKVRFPELEEKANRFIWIVKRLTRWLVLLIAGGAAAQLWGVPVSGMIGSKIGIEVIMRGITIMVTLLMVAGVVHISNFASDYVLKAKGTAGQKLQTLIPMLRAAVKISTFFVAGVVILQQLGVNTTPILAGAGILGLAVGFGSQTLVKDLINGIFILFEESLRVGDWVDLGGNSGMVESVGLRTVRLRDVSGNVHVIPNSAIDRMINYTKEYSRIIADVGVAYRENTEEVIEILKQIGAEMQADDQYGSYMLQPLEIFGLDRFDDSAVIIRVRFTTKPMMQWMVRREFNRRVKEAFDQRGIEIPFPHRTIYIGEAKDGSSPPLRLDSRRKENRCCPEPVSGRSHKEIPEGN